MDILITGGLGFIGTNLADSLLKQGHLLYLVDDLSTGRHTNLTWLYRNNREATNQGKLRFIQIDITSPSFLQVLKSQGVEKIDQVYHLACPASPPKYWLDPLKTLDINYVGTKNVLEVARAKKARILFTSTSEIYGDPLVHPQPESYNGNVDPISPRSVYDEGKRVAETLVSQYHRTYGMETKIARIFNTYGPRMDPDDGRVVTNFIKQTLENSPITIYGDGSQTRSFCFVTDQVSGLIILMNSADFINQPVNIGNPKEITINELANEIVVQILEDEEQYAIHMDLPASDPTRRKPDISKMKSLGWNPQVGLATGIKETVEYMREELV